MGGQLARLRLLPAERKIPTTVGVIDPDVVDSAAEHGQARILVVDPHPTLRMVLAQRLRQDGHMAAAVGTVAEALELCVDQQPELLVSAELLEESSALRLAAQLR